MNKKEYYTIINNLIQENGDLIDLVRDLIRECWKDDPRTMNFALNHFDTSVEMSADYGGIPSLQGIKYRLESLLKQQEEKKP